MLEVKIIIYTKKAIDKLKKKKNSAIKENYI